MSVTGYACNSDSRRVNTMKRFFTHLTSALTSAAMLAGLVSALPAGAADTQRPEPTGYAKVTVNVYDSSTDKLFDADNVMFSLFASTEEGRKKGVSYLLDDWRINDGNPHVCEDVPVSPDYTYNFDLTWNKYDNYSYTIRDIEWDLPFTLENDEDKSINIYLEKKYNAGVFGSFFVYLGRDKDNQAELMQFYTDTDSDGGTLRKKQVTYLGTLGEDTAYGDIFETEEEAFITGPVTDYKLKSFEKFDKTGNITQMCEKKTFTVYSAKTEKGLKPSYDTINLRMTPDEANYYNYRLKLNGLDFPYNFDNIRQGDTLDFYTMGRNIIIPAGQYIHEPQFMGDLNNDRLLTVADVVLMQKWLLGSEEVKMMDWSAVDYDNDGVLDVYDLCLMRKALIEELSVPRATMAVHVTYGGYGIDGQDLGHGEFDSTYTVRKGDWYVEIYNGEWLRNEKVFGNREAIIITITDVTDEGVSFVAKEMNYNSEDKEFTLKYGEEQHLYSMHMVMDGTNYDYDVTFTEFLAPIK